MCAWCPQKSDNYIGEMALVFLVCEDALVGGALQSTLPAKR